MKVQPSCSWPLCFLFQVYTIEVRHGEMNWEVTRRYQDFAQLHMRLTEELATQCLLPELPPTKWYHNGAEHVGSRYVFL